MLDRTNLLTTREIVQWRLRLAVVVIITQDFISINGVDPSVGLHPNKGCHGLLGIQKRQADGRDVLFVRRSDSVPCTTCTNPIFTHSCNVRIPFVVSPARRISFCLFVTGASNFCVACGHGGHTYHLMTWFESMDVCPSGCGCRCLEVGTFIVDWRRAYTNAVMANSVTIAPLEMLSD